MNVGNTASCVAIQASPGREPLISVKGVSKTYATRRGGNVLAIGEVNLELAEQEFVSLIGPSGCGKSTLLHVTGGLLKPTTGHVLVRGEDRPIRAEEFGMVFQDAVLFPWLTIRQNVEMPAQVLRVPKSVYRPRSAQLLELVGLGNFGDAYPRELSGGMQQRAAIARSLIHDPELLLMDEPFGAVDAITRETLNIELQRIRTVARKSVLFVTHSIAEAVFLSDRVVVMSARPSQIRSIIDIDLPAERGPEMIESPEFDSIVRKIHRELGRHVH
ncbi:MULTISPECIES: ABC transporter ATP-binding protein [Rhodopseudomonas]|uniref:ABC transporter ATP-binding protein n=1 Tax=Rhodopseudomonas TaxID=1073 RepID=UPI0009BC2F47|nr:MULTISPECIES: ABC transporter ATP-binding protein [Rhodopseudomonas]MDF3811020.1 ABC transporter ATP-binding protein [Rhodopseudomonas sp. BAL398]WOK15918.1 ABC transporter ATP-binding protein [Rhodopseudomonas sp. BAL398]